MQRRSACLRTMLAERPLRGSGVAGALVAARLSSAGQALERRRRSSTTAPASGAAASTTASTSSRASATAPTRPRAASCRRWRPSRGPACATRIEFGPIAPQPGMRGRPMSEDCLHLNVWTPGLRDNAQASGDGVVPRRRLLERHQQRDRNRRRAAQPRAATSWSSPSTIGSTRSAISISPSSAAPDARRLRQRRHARPGAGAAVGARQHRGVRRRRRQRHDLRPVGRRREVRHADGDAGGARAVPPRHHA